MAQAKDLVSALKAALKAEHLTYRDVAKRLRISEASVKRLFATGRFSLHRLEAVCELLNLEVSDLAELAVERTPKLTALTPAQESALLKDPKLLLVTYLVLSHWQYEEIVETFAIDEHEAIRLLAELDRLHFIQLLPGNRIKLLTTRNFSWRPDGEVQRFFEREVLPEFLRTGFRGRAEKMQFVGGLLSEASLERFQASLEKLAREFDELVEADAKLPLEHRHSSAALLAARAWEFSKFATFKRRPELSASRKAK